MILLYRSSVLTKSIETVSFTNITGLVYISLMSSVYARGPEDESSIPGWVMSKT